MSAWPSHPSPMPPPRDGRSRSPSRGGYGRYPPYPDSGYPGDSYRGEWDAHSRDRAWSEYERDRPPHDYGRRGRSRSPGGDDGRKRRRSPSPYDRDRFDPRPRYNDDYDAHSRSMDHHSPRVRGQYGNNFGSRPSRAPVDPHTLDYPASLKQYAEWFRYFYPQQASEEDLADKTAEQEAGDGSKPRNGIKTRWEKYKKEFLATQLQTLFDHHRKSPWFAEKYDPSPEFVSLRTRVRKTGWKGRTNQFLSELEEGKFDSNFAAETDAEPSSPMSPTATREKESLDLPDAGDGKKDDDDFGMNMDGDEEAADNGDIKLDMNGKGLVDGKRTLRADELSVMPEGNQVMIRTIPPDIGRVKLENALKDIPGFTYLALGDPMQKRNYYRAGWIKFTQDADMEKTLTSLGEKKIEGFKLHVSHITKPFVNKIRQAPEVASKPDRIVKDLDQVKKLVGILEDEYDKIRQFKVEPKPQGEGDANGDTSATNQDVDQNMEEADDEPRERGVDAVERRIAKLHEELPQPADENDMWMWENKKNVIALDLYLAYLREAFNTCYYCASITDHVEELQRKCIKHVRKPLSKAAIAEIAALQMGSESKESDETKPVTKGEQVGAEKPKDVSGKDKAGDKKDPDGRDPKRNDDRWLDWLDGKIALLINKNDVDPREYGGKKYDDELTKAVEPHIKQEDEGKYRCKTCLKLFKATSFVEKHIANKHSELLKPLEDLTYFNNFALDPQRIQPFTHPPAFTGNAQAAPPQAFGIQAPPQFMDPTRSMPSPYYGGYLPPQAFPPPYVNGGGWDGYGYHGGFPPPPVPVARSLRDEPPLSSGRRLGDRIGGYAPGHDAPPRVDGGHGIEGLPPKPPPALETSQSGRRNGRGGPPPPPPPDAKEDPRAATGRRVSYHDMDLVAEGDVELQY